ncbi:hypothetical protein OOK44_36200 [Streptomyces cellulosae]|uniref:Uncharacterized protein n=1 Tax=Streptomyces althioticus TaxID=83380 RepID=A0ABZ1YJM2_9ACTN|nr:hypothetical protein [Streptomyces cellulosae]WTB93446.1 hypothetical protein OIE99_34950 [Streptomyces cellulosae]WTC60837.1 hypothetical protein OH715_36700 [Streptomyces cellulosae]
MTPDTDAIARRLRAELPAQIAALPKDRRGYPITFVTAIGDDGTPDFTELDGPRRAQAIVEQLCGICGQAIPLIRAVIGGLQVVESHLTLDPPMCVGCAVFAATHAAAGCPFLLMPNARYRKARTDQPTSPLASEQRASTFFLARTFAHEAVRARHPDGSEDVMALCARWTSLEMIAGGELVDARHLISR